MIKSTTEQIEALQKLKKDLSEAITPIFKAYAAKADNVLPEAEISHVMSNETSLEYRETVVTLLHKI